MSLNSFVASSKRAIAKTLILGTAATGLAVGATVASPTAESAEAAVTWRERVKAFVAADSRDPYSYVYGQAGPYMFDCSGLTKWSYARAGKYLPRSSSSQRSAVPRITRSQLQKGDLIFFHSSSSRSSSSVYHVGIYAGSGRYFHASNPRTDLKYSSLAYASGYLSYGRVA